MINASPACVTSVGTGLRGFIVNAGFGGTKEVIAVSTMGKMRFVLVRWMSTSDWPVVGSAQAFPLQYASARS